MKSNADNWTDTLATGDYANIAKAYADYMIESGRDVYGEKHTPLFMTVLNRKTGKAFKPPYPHVVTKPYAPGLRRDHKMRPGDRTYQGSNPLEDLPLYGLLYRLTELTGEKRYAEEADKSIAYFFENGWSETTKLPAWGSHMYYDVEQDIGVFAGGNPNDGYGGHEYNMVWTYWEKHPEVLKRFAEEVWNQHINKKDTGHFNRHSKEGGGGMEFPQTGSCFMDIWAREYGRSGGPEMKKHIQTLLGLYTSMRDPSTGAMSWCSSKAAGRRELSNVHMNLSMATTLQDAAKHVEARDPELAEELRVFVQFIDDEFLSNDYDKILDVAGKGILGWYMVEDRSPRPEGMTPAPDGVDTSVGFPVKAAASKPAASLYYLTPWFPGRSYAEFGVKLKGRHLRCEEKHKDTYRRALLDIADIYMTILPEVQFAQYPDNISDVVEILRYVYCLTDEAMYLRRADQIMQLGLKLFFDETSPLPKITNCDDWYESSTKNESSVEILRQMLELKLDLAKLTEDERKVREVESRIENGSHTVYLSDIINRIPTTEEADKLNGRMKRFTGKGHASSHIAYGGFKDVPVKVTLTLHNTGKQEIYVTVTADLHDAYHDNGQVSDERTMPGGESEIITISAPARKWIRRLSIRPSASLNLEAISFAAVKRSKLQE